MAEQIVNDIKEAGGVMTLSDLENFEVAKRTPLKTKINNMHILTTGAPSSGAFLALALKVCVYVCVCGCECVSVCLCVSVLIND